MLADIWSMLLLIRPIAWRTCGLLHSVPLLRPTRQEETVAERIDCSQGLAPGTHVGFCTAHNCYTQPDGKNCG